MPEKQDFQIPQELREFAEKNVQQARVAYGQLMEFMTQAVRAWSTAPSTMMASGFKSFRSERFNSQRKTPTLFALASELAKAKDLQDILRLQSNFCPDTDAVLRAAGAGAWWPHGGGHAQQQTKRLSAPIRACPPDWQLLMSPWAGREAALPPSSPPARRKFEQGEIDPSSPRMTSRRDEHPSTTLAKGAWRCKNICICKHPE
jgi:hypothetical protein